MNIGYHLTLIAGKTANLYILANGKEELLNLFFNGLSVLFKSQKSVNVSRVLLGNDFRNFSGKSLESVAVGNEVGLTVNLNNSAHTVLGVCANSTLGSYAACLFGLRSKSLLTEKISRCFHISVALGESLFAVHHAAAGLLS